MRKIKESIKQTTNYWEQEFRKKPLKYFLKVFFGMFISSGFLVFGYLIRDKFFNEIYYYAWMVVSAVFLLMAFRALFSYLIIIIKNKK